MNKLNSILFAGLILLTTHLVFLSLFLFGAQTSLNAPRIHIKDSNSLNWAGYAVETSLSSPQSGAVTDVKGSWTVPAVDCSATPTSWSAFWVGIDGYSSSTVEQIGTDSDCSSGTAKYYAWYEMYPKFPVNLNIKVSPRDVISAEVSYIGKGSFKLTITDTSTGRSYTTTQKSPSASRSSAEWVAEAPSSSSRVLLLANFGTVLFSSSSATLNGHTGTISDTSWQYDPMTMTTSSGVPKATPSALSNDGSSFSVAWNSPGS